MTDALEDHECTVGIGGRTITNLRYADDIDGLAGEEEELANLAERLDKASTAWHGDQCRSRRLRNVKVHADVQTSGFTIPCRKRGQCSVTVRVCRILYHT